MKISRNFVKTFLVLFLVIIIVNIVTPFFGVWNIYYLVTLMLFIIALFFLVYRKKDNGTIKFLKLLILLIPIIILGYIFYANFVVSQDFNYFYDIGSQTDANKPYLTPANRVSEIYNDSEITYRNITSQLVYFDVLIPKSADTIDVALKFKDNLPLTGTTQMGAKNKPEWSYLQKSVYSPTLSNLENYNFTGSNTRIYLINKNMPLVNNISEIPRYSIVGENIGLNPKINTQTYTLKNLTITTSLRDSHTFYVYLDNSLSLQLKKQDLNWYEGEDNLTISLYDLYGNLIGNTTIQDDGIINVNKTIAKIQTGNLTIENLTRGIYLLKFSKYDGIIREIKLNTNKIVTKNIFLADSNAYLNNTEKISSLYTKANKKSQLSFMTYHKEGYQNISINKNNLEINNISQTFSYNLTEGEYTIKTLKNDLIVSSFNYLSFSKDSYFEPFDFVITSIPQKIEDINKLDYIVTDYTSISSNNGWLVGKTKFELKDLYISNGKLSLDINMPHFSKEEYSNITIPIDWINITVHKNGIFEKDGN